MPPHVHVHTPIPIYIYLYNSRSRKNINICLNRIRTKIDTDFMSSTLVGTSILRPPSHTHMASASDRTTWLPLLYVPFYLLYSLHWWRPNSTLVSIVFQFPCGFYSWDLLIAQLIRVAHRTLDDQCTLFANIVYYIANYSVEAKDSSLGSRKIGGQTQVDRGETWCPLLHVMVQWGHFAFVISCTMYSVILDIYSVLHILSFFSLLISFPKSLNPYPLLSHT